MRVSRRERRATPTQLAAYEARPYHFRIHYTHRWNTGFGNGSLDWGQDRPEFTAADRDDFIRKVTAVTAANTQADGMEFDPSTLFVDITDVIPLDGPDTKTEN